MLVSTFFFLVFSTLNSLFAFSSAVAATPVLNEVTLPSISISLILSLLVGLYELVVRLVPTVSNISLLAKLIDLLKWISDFLNRKK
jgi:uncharacterized membrane protein